MRNKFKVLPFLILITFYQDSLASEDLCNRLNLGWHFYCDDKNNTKNDKKVKEDPVAALKAIKEELEYRQALAIYEPTEENIVSFKEYSAEQLNRSSYFADMFERVTWKHPELDYTIKRPVDTLGKRVWIDERNKAKKETIDNLEQRYGIFFFYNAGCIRCQKFSPVLKNFSERYNLHIMAVSLDGELLPEWPESVVDNGQAEKFGLMGKGLPATILFDNETKQIIPLGYSILSEEEIINRIFAQTKLEVGNDY